MSTKTWVFGSSQVILRWFYGKVPKSYEIFQMVITWVFWKRFEVCKSLKYSSGNWLSDCDIEKQLSGHSCPPQLQLKSMRTLMVLTGYEGSRANSGRRLLNNYCSTWPIGSIGHLRKTHQDTPVLHNSNQEGIRMGMVLTGVEGFTATSDYKALSAMSPVCWRGLIFW